MVRNFKKNLSIQKHFLPLHSHLIKMAGKVGSYNG